MVATRSSSKAPESAPPPAAAAAATPPPPAVASAATPAATTTATTAPTTRSRPARTNNNNNASKSAVAAAPSTSTPTTTTGWAHTPSTLTLAWLALSLPLVIWDTGYVLGRPATMPGGWAHAPLYTPYALYGEVDHMYGLKQWAAGNGFTSAQGTLNVVETLFYLVYLAIWYRAAPAHTTTSNGGGGAARKAIAGRAAAWAVLFAFSAAVMTLSKTVLYWLNEVFSDFDNIGHNALGDLILLWIIPKYVYLFTSCCAFLPSVQVLAVTNKPCLPSGAWLIGPTYMIYQLGAELVDAINIASQATGSVKEE